MEEEYEILPHQELEYLRKEVERLKKNPLGSTETSQTLLDSMNNLTQTINKLLHVFESASDEIIQDYEQNKLSDRMDRIAEQNEKLAEGMVAVGELVKKVLLEEKRQEDFRGGFRELGNFTTNVHQAQKEHRNHNGNNNLPKGPSPFQDQVNINTDNLPKHDFRSMDPGREVNTQRLPPPPNGAGRPLPPSLRKNMPKNIPMDEIPSPQ